MKFIDKNTLKLDKILNELDKFVLRFIKVLGKHCNYVIVSGYVSILLGRARATEDVDIFIEKLSKEEFLKLYNDLKKDYWCLNAEKSDAVYSYLSDGWAVRFAEKKQTIPNFEIKFAIENSAVIAIKNPLVVILAEGKLKLSSLEQQIAYKRYCLKSDKDIEDAAHLEKVFKDKINKEEIEKYKALMKHETEAWKK